MKAPRAVAERLARLFPELDATGRETSLDIYRKLSRGAPVELGDAAARKAKEWPGVYYDAERRVIGFWGLSLAPMRHRLRVGARELFAWCAWDTLFLPAVLGARIDVASVCEATGVPVRLAVQPDAVEWARPRELAVSFVIPDSKAVRADVITSFCHYVHFFASQEAAALWLEKQRDAFLLSLADAFEVGRLLNRRRYGAAL